MNKPTKEQIEIEAAGPRIDAWFAELVMGWKVEWHDCQQEPECGEWEAHIWSKSGYYETRNLPCYKDKCGYLKPVPFYSTDIAHVMEGVEKAMKNGLLVVIETTIDLIWNVCFFHPREHSFIIDYSALNKDLPLAITRALLLWAIEKCTSKS